MKNKLRAAAAVALLALALMYSGCNLGGEDKRSNAEWSPAIHAEEAARPLITRHPHDHTYFLNDAAVLDLSIEAAPLPKDEDGETMGVLSCQWYSNTVPLIMGGTAIEGETGDTFTPPITTAQTGSYYYYAALSNYYDKADAQYQTAVVFSKVAHLKVVDAPAALPSANATVTINTNATYQYVRGFGGMDVAWGNFPSMTIADFDTMFNPDKLGYTMLRIMILPDSEDIEETMYNLVNNITYPDAERRHQYEFVRMVNRWGGYVLASPWSPPIHWKTNQALGGQGSLMPEYYMDYALYLNSFARHMYNNNAPIYAISIQNEPNYMDDYDGCRWSPAQMRDFFKQVGRFTMGVKGYGGGEETIRVKTMNGESANTPEINDAAMNDPLAWQNIDLIGRHNYGGTGEKSKALTHSSPREVWMTEHNINSNAQAAYPNDSTYNYVWKLMNDIDITIRLNDESAFIWWAMKRFYSFIGDGQHSTTNGTILPRGYGMSHYAKFAAEMRRANVTVSGTLANGSTAISSSNVNSSARNMESVDAKVTAFVSEDGNTISLIMFTPTSDSGSGGYDLGTVKIQLPAGFIAGSAVAMRSTSANMGRTEWEDVILDSSRNAAYVNLPRSEILSVRFSR